MKKTLPLSFFDRPTLAVARGLLGKYLVRRERLRGRRRGSRTRAVMITEVEAYDGPRDRASHASRGRTPRNAPMFGPAGRFYVYFTYGMHWLANIVTGPMDYPAAVLLRGGVYKGTRAGGRTRHLNGPARLTKFLEIDRRQNGKVAARKTGLWLEDRGLAVAHGAIIARRRVGVDYAGRHWAGKRYNLSITAQTAASALLRASPPSLRRAPRRPRQAAFCRRSRTRRYMHRACFRLRSAFPRPCREFT